MGAYLVWLARAYQALGSVLLRLAPNRLRLKGKPQVARSWIWKIYPAGLARIVPGDRHKVLVR